METPLDALFISVGDNEEDKALPLGVAFLAGQLKAAGFSYDVFDLSNRGWVNESLSELMEIVDRRTPSVIGISSTGYYIKKVRKLIRLLRATHTSSLIVIGGYISLIPHILRQTNADVVCLGEGDKTIVSLLHAVSQEKPLNDELKKIPGIRFRNNGVIVGTQKKLPIDDLDVIAFPDFSIFDLNSYSHPNSLPMYAQRGCYNNCSFCDIIPFYKIQYIRRMSPGRVLEWIEKSVRDYDIKRVDFMDDNFLNSRPFVEKFFHLLKKYNESLSRPVPVKINFQARSNEVLRFKSVLERYKSYINSIQLGTESFSQSQLDRWQKNLTRLDNVNAIKFLSDANITFVNYYLWIDPETTVEELYENVDIVLELPPTPLHLSDSEVPNCIYNYEISAIYDRVGISSVGDIPELNAAETFLNETNAIAKEISFIYIGLKVLLDQNEALKEDRAFYQSITSFFQLSERFMEKRLNMVPHLVDQVQKKRLFKKKRANEILPLKLEEMKKMGKQIILPLRDKLKLDLENLTGR